MVYCQDNKGNKQKTINNNELLLIAESPLHMPFAVALLPRQKGNINRQSITHPMTTVYLII